MGVWKCFVNSLIHHVTNNSVKRTGRARRSIYSKEEELECLACYLTGITAPLIVQRQIVGRRSAEGRRIPWVRNLRHRFGFFS